MKDLFPGHFRPSDTAFRETWSKSMLVLDANILLNLYRYSDGTRREFIRLLGKLRDRVWIPNRAAEVYLSNRLSVIDQQERAYDETEKTVASLRAALENARQHPFVSEPTMAKVTAVFAELSAELAKNKERHTRRLMQDDIRDAIADIFDGRVGKPYDKATLESIIAEGEERYRQKVPPGYKDGSKSGDSELFLERCRRFGDLILWKQVVDKARDEKMGVIFVTDDKKEDWWDIFKGKTIGPRPELVAEFVEQTGTTFYMYQADRFLELAREELQAQVSPQIVEEVREVRQRDVQMRKKRATERAITRNNHLDAFRAELDHARKELAVLDAERARFRQYVRAVQGGHDAFLAAEHTYMPGDEGVSRYSSEIEHELSHIQSAIDRNEAQRLELLRRIASAEALLANLAAF